jgi:hypothetical protein
MSCERNSAILKESKWNCWFHINIFCSVSLILPVNDSSLVQFGKFWWLNFFLWQNVKKNISQLLIILGSIWLLRHKIFAYHDEIFAKVACSTNNLSFLSTFVSILFSIVSSMKRIIIMGHLNTKNSFFIFFYFLHIYKLLYTYKYVINIIYICVCVCVCLCVFMCVCVWECMCVLVCVYVYNNQKNDL